MEKVRKQTEQCNFFGALSKASDRAGAACGADAPEAETLFASGSGTGSSFLASDPRALCVPHAAADSAQSVPKTGKIVCAISGHRVLGTDFSYTKLRESLRKLAEAGTDTFLCGMALGFDVACAEEILKMRADMNVRLVACVPCADQAARYTRAQREQYERILASCDESVILHERYCEGCMFERNRYMVDRCDFLFAYLKEERGGTYYTVRYARKKGCAVCYF